MLFSQTTFLKHQRQSKMKRDIHIYKETTKHTHQGKIPDMNHIKESHYNSDSPFDIIKSSIFYCLSSSSTPKYHYLLFHLTIQSSILLQSQSRMDKSHVIQYSSESTHKLNTLSDLRQCRWSIYRPLLIIGHAYQISFNLQKIVNLVSLQQHLNKNKQNKRSKKPLWGKEQVNKFLELLKVYGSDFSIIAKVMGKERIDIRRKFKYLQKNNPKLIDIIFDDKPSLCPQQLNEFLDY